MKKFKIGDFVKTGDGEVYVVNECDSTNVYLSTIDKVTSTGTAFSINWAIPKSLVKKLSKEEIDLYKIKR